MKKFLSSFNSIHIFSFQIIDHTSRRKIVDTKSIEKLQVFENLEVFHYGTVQKI